MIYVSEKFNGRRTSSGSKPAQSYDVRIRRDAADPDTGDDSDLRAAIAAVTPSMVFDSETGVILNRTNYGITEELGPCLWSGTVEYASEENNKNTGDSLTTFETSGGSQKILQSIQTQGSFAAAGFTAPNFKGAIGVTDDSIEGVDIVVPVFTWSETWYLATLTPAYANILFDKTGCTNTSTFRNLPDGDCLFLGACGSKRGRGDWEITFKFAGSKTRNNFQVGDITITKKRGWEYLWVRYAKTVSGAGASKMVAMKPRFAYVEQVYFETDFDPLGIGS